MILCDLFPDATPDDWRLYVEHTIVMCRQTDSPDYRPVFIHKIEYPKIVLLDLEQDRKISWDVRECYFKLFYPEPGYYSTKRTCVWLSRQTSRQNKKGICDSTISTLNMADTSSAIIQDRVYAQFHREELPPSFHTGFLPSIRTPRDIWQILFDPVRFFSFDKAVHSILSRRTFARALTPSFAVSMGIVPEFPLALWFNSILVGGSNNSDRITVTQPLFFQEIHDVFSKIAEVTAQ